MRLAPEVPTTETLHKMHPLSDQGRQKVHNKRIETANAIRFGHRLLAIIGPCAMTDDAKAILNENRRITEFESKNNMVVLHRLPPWKPRTNPDDWHGLETSNPEEAHRIAVAIAEQSGNLAMEFGHISHLGRYSLMAAMGWRGSRNDSDNSLLRALRESDESLPIAIKNGMDGTVDSAFHLANVASYGRQAPATLLFRGGALFDTQDKWIEQYEQVLAITGGNVIVDAAHGGEQAHDPAQKFGKSALGQLACLESIILAAERTGRVPHGVMVEASDVTSPTDPVVALGQAFKAISELAAVHHKTNQ